MHALNGSGSSALFDTAMNRNSEVLRLLLDKARIRSPQTPSVPLNPIEADERSVDSGNLLSFFVTVVVVRVDRSELNGL